MVSLGYTLSSEEFRPNDLVANARRAEERHPPVGRILEVDGVRMHVASWGEGAPVVLIHGNGTVVGDWAISGLVDRLVDDGHRVIALDRPGYGHSDRPRDRIWDAYAQADLIARTLARLGVERPVVVGHSWGAIVAAALAIKHEGMLGGIVLLSGYYFPTGRVDVWLLSPPAIPVVGDVLRYTVAPPLGRFVVAPALIRRVFEPSAPTSRSAPRSCAPAPRTAGSWSRPRWRWWTTTATSPCPSPSWPAKGTRS